MDCPLNRSGDPMGNGKVAPLRLAPFLTLRPLPVVRKEARSEVRKASGKARARASEKGFKGKGKKKHFADESFDGWYGSGAYHT